MLVYGLECLWKRLGSLTVKNRETTKTQEISTHVSYKYKYVQVRTSTLLVLSLACQIQVRVHTLTLN